MASTRELGLRQSQLHGRVHAGLHDGHGLGVGHADVLAGRAQETPAGGDEVPGLQEPGQVVEGGVRVAPPEGLHEGGGHVVHGVAPPVVAHGAALTDLLRVGEGHAQGALLAPGGLVEELHRVHGLAHVPAAGVGDVPGHGLLPDEGQGALRFHQGQGPLHGGQDLGGGDGFELEHCAPAEKGRVDVEVGVLSGGGDEGDGPVLHKLQQGLLLLLVEVLDLVQVQQHTAGRQQRSHVADDVLDVLEGRRGGVETVQGLLCPLRNDVGDGGLPRAGGPVEDHVGVGAALDQAAEHRAGGQDVALSHHLVQCLGADLIRQGTLHRETSLLF